jgi:uncharacterized membrane protein
MKTSQAMTAAIFGLGLACASTTVSGQTWTYVDRLIPEDASADGRVVVGSSVGGSARWTAAGGLQVFGTEPGFGILNEAHTITADGTQIFGSTRPDFSNHDDMYRWTGPGTLDSLGVFGLADAMRANAASADGRVVVGTGSADQGTIYQGYLWTAQGGFRSIPGVGSYSTAVAVSADGTKVAGTRRSGDRTQAYTWSEAQGLTVLRTPNALSTQAFDMTADGRYVVGTSHSGGPVGAIRWDQGDPLALGVLENFRTSVAASISDDGSIVTGYCMELLSPGDPNLNQFVWTASWGMLEVHDFLGRHGIVLPSELYLDRVKVTGDGRTIYAYAFDGRGSYATIVATIPTPGCLGILGVVALGRRRRVPSTSALRR